MFKLTPKAPKIADLETQFLKMLVTRLAEPENTYRSKYDIEAIRRFNNANVQDSEYVDISDLAIAQFHELNPNLNLLN
jgi:hypothetical protein